MPDSANPLLAEVRLREVEPASEPVDCSQANPPLETRTAPPLAHEHHSALKVAKRPSPVATPPLLRATSHWMAWASIGLRVAPGAWMKVRVAAHRGPEQP